MAIKAYKHLTDGEVKLVATGSAEETALLADTVKGGSYLQMTSAGHAQEVAAAQGTALWVDVTSDLGGGGGSSFDHLTEDAGTSALVTDWKLGFQDGTDPADTFLSRIAGPGTTTLVGTQQLVVVADEDDAQGWFDGTPYSGQVAYVAPNGIGINTNAGVTTNVDVVGLSCHNAGSVPSVDFFSDSGNLFLNNQMLSLGADNGVIEIKSPDGTIYHISVSNAGAIVVAPA